VALLEGHLDPASLPLRKEEEGLYHPCEGAGGEGEGEGGGGGGHYDVRTFCFVFGMQHFLHRPIHTTANRSRASKGTA
jgi:hypothetical protein